MYPTLNDDRTFLQAMIGDGRPLLTLVALGLILFGLFAIFLAVTGQFLPHDEQYLGMTAKELCALHGCRIVHFMIHDRGSFGGALIAIGLVYLWLIAFPLQRGQAWGWWLLLVTGLIGFGSFFAYLGYGYLDTWHGAGTLAILPCFVVGLFRTRALLTCPAGPASLFRPAVPLDWRTATGLGRICLLATTAGIAGAGFTILLVGMTCVFVPQDLQYMGVQVEELESLNPRLVPLIAHDRAGFGGAIACAGVAMFFCGWCGTPSRGLWQVLALAGGIGFGTAIGVHPAIGYNDVVHLAPAVTGAAFYLLGLVLTFPRVSRRMQQPVHCTSGRYARVSV